MDAVMELADRHAIVVIEDAAHALPARYHGQMVGSIADVTCFSFYANKTITTGEGGMATTADPAVAERMRSLSLHGLSNDAWNRYSSGGTWDYAVVAAGFKYNLTDIAACLGLDQLARADDFAAERQRVASLYDEMFSGSELVTPLEVGHGIEHARHLYVVRLNVAALSRDRNWVIEELRAHGIATSVHYRPIHMHEYYRTTLQHEPTDFPVAAAAFDEIISLPIYPLMADEDVEYVASVLLDTLSGIQRS
jgi:perosamine synthetase